MHIAQQPQWRTQHANLYPQLSRNLRLQILLSFRFRDRSGPEDR